MRVKGASETHGPDAKRCPDCGEVKPLDDFPRFARMKDGRGTYCKPCHNARGRKTKQRLYGGNRHHHLKNRYGIGADEVAAMITAQGGMCPICRKRAATQVDHDHTTGHVRGILCLHCNAGMGAFKDDPAIIASAIQYLERNSA